MTTKKMQEKIKFYKADILTAKKYTDKRDLVEAVVPKDFYGTLEDVDSLIKKFMKGKVK
ncbi:MAG: hypothetical protein MRZ89_01260 [Lachnospiraceae bacterium]|nr:hypothetical protein [Lachnospiraceae bacterium]